MEFMLQVLSSEYSYSEPSETWGPMSRGCSKELLQPLGDEDTTDCASDTSSASSSEDEPELEPMLSRRSSMELEPELEPEMDELLEAHEEAMQKISSIVATPLATPAVPVLGCDAKQVIHGMKKVLGVDFVTDRAFDLTMMRALKLLHDVEYDLDEVVAAVAHACALAKRCPEAITDPICGGDLRLGAERIVALVALAMIDLDDESCELVTWRRYVLPHMTTKNLNTCIHDMLCKVGRTTHVTAEEWHKVRAELGC